MFPSLTKKKAEATIKDEVILPPPPARQPVRRLSLNTAIAAATRREGADMQPLLSPKDEFPSVKTQSGKQQEMEAHLLELQAEIIVREDQVSQNEKRLQAHELGLNEREALLAAKLKLVESMAVTSEISDANNAAKVISEEANALKALQSELLRQEASLQEARKMLREREDFIEQCENELVEKSMQLTEREAHVEQDEEDAEARNRRAGLNENINTK